MLPRAWLSLAATCWLAGPAAPQLWDAEGLSPGAPVQSRRPHTVSALLADVLGQQYDTELVVRNVSRGDDEPPPPYIPEVKSTTIAEVVKCCPLGENFRLLRDQNGELVRRCAPTDIQLRPIFYDYNTTHLILFETNDWSVTVNDPCQHGKYILNPAESDQDEFYLLTNGSLLTPHSKISLLGTSDFCMEVIWEDETNGEDAPSLPMVCFPSSETGEERVSQLRLIIIAIVMLMSVPLLLVTAAVYMLTEELRDPHGIALSYHCCCLSVAFLTLALAQLLGPDPGTSMCVVAAVVVQLFFFGSFIWLTIMCYDIYINTKKNTGNQSNCGNGRSRMFWYNAIGFGGPIVLLTITCAVEFTPGVPMFMHKPNFGNQGCWFKNDLSAVLYFYGPMGTMLGINLLLFFMTCHLARESRRDPSGSSNSLGNSDSRIVRYGKMLTKSFMLSLMMGLNWFFELISWIVGGNEWNWIMFDLMNAGQGFIILYIYMKKENSIYFYNFLRKTFPWMTCLPISSEADRSSELTNFMKETSKNGIGEAV